jgi:hypothetical protein
LERLLAPRFRVRRRHGTDTALVDLNLAVGANGGDSDRVVEYLSYASEHKEIGYPDYLFVNCGLHDIRVAADAALPQVDENRYRANLEQICVLGRRLAGHLIWVTSTPVDDTVHNDRASGFCRYQHDGARYDRVAREVMAANQISIADLRACTTAILGAIGVSAAYVDHVHFAQAVQSQQAAYLAGWIHAYQSAIG